MASLALVLVSGCKPKPPRLISRQHARAPAAAIADVRWVDRGAGTVELVLRCTVETIEVWCPEYGDCARRTQTAPVACPAGAEVILVAGDVRARAPLRGARAVFAAPAAPPATWTVELAASAVSAPDDRTVLALPLGPPSTVAAIPPPPGRRPTVTAGAPPPDPVPPTARRSAAAQEPEQPVARRAPRARRRYHGTVIVADLAVLASAIAGGNQTGRAEDLFAASLIAYVVTGPVVHLAHGNRRGAGTSLARRLLCPVGGAIVGGALLSAYAGEPPDGCGYGCLFGGILGAGAGTALAIGVDWAWASVPRRAPTVMPVISGDGERVVVGVGGAF